jgi:hypothetical protein
MTFSYTYMDTLGNTYIVTGIEGSSACVTAQINRK